MKRKLLLLTLLSFVPLLAPGQTNFARMFSGINYVSTNSYLVQSSDVTKVVVFTNGGPTAVTMPPGSSANFGAGSIYVLQGGPTAGTITISCACMMNASALPITIGANQTATFQSDGSGYVVSANGTTGATSGGGLQVGAGSLGLLTTCAPNQVLQWNGAAWACASAGTGNVSTTPAAAQNVVQPPSAGVSTPFSANNFAFWRVVTPSWNWSYTDSAGSLGNLTAAGSATLTLPCSVGSPCPLGIDTASAANHYIYRIYISGTGTPEAALVTGGTCTPGATASCTLIVTTLNVHANGYTIGSSTGGIQEAWNDAWVNDSGVAPNANSQAGPYVKLAADTQYNVYSSIYLRGRGGVLDGAGALMLCTTRDRCIFVGINGVSTDQKLLNLNATTNVNQDGVQVASVSAAAGTYTVTSASAHGFSVGDTVDCEYYSQNSSGHWVSQAIAPTSGTTLTVSFGANTFSTSANTYGWCNILNAFIEDNSEHVKMDAINIFVSNPAGGCGGGCFGSFSYGIVNDNDQQLQITHFGNRGSPILRSGLVNGTANFPNGAMYYGRNDQGNNGIGYIHDSEFTNVNCGTAGGNGFVVSDTVCQAFPLFGFRYFGGLQPVTITNVYQDVANDNPLYHAIYSQAVPAMMGYLVQGGRANRIVGAFPPVNRIPQFPCTAGGGATRNYWVIPHSSAGAAPGAGSPLFIGFATSCNGGNITVAWPMVQLQDHAVLSNGNITWDVLMTTTGATQAPSGTGSFFLTTPGAPITAACTTSGMCTFVDTQAAAVSGTVPTQVFQPNFWFWPGSYVINWGSALQLDTVDTNPGAVGSFGTLMPSINAAQCTSFGAATQRSPIWVNCQGTGGTAGQFTLAQIFAQKDASNVNPVPNSKGRINLGSAINTPNDLITLQDSNLPKTLSTAGHRPLNDAADIAIGTDVSGGLNFRAGTSIDFNINSIPTNANYTAIVNSTGLIATAFGPSTNNWKFVDGIVNATTNAVADACETYPANTGLRTCVIYSPPELIATNPFPPNYAPEWRIVPGSVHSTLCDTTHIYCILVSRPILLGSQGTIVGVGPVGTGGDMSSGSLIMNDPVSFPAPIGIPSSPGTMTCTAGATAYDFAIRLVVPLNSHTGGIPPAGGPGAYAKYHLAACAASGNTFAMTGGTLPSGTLAGSLTPTEYEVGFSTTGANGPYFAQTAANLGCTSGTLAVATGVPYSCTIAGGSFSIAQANLTSTSFAFESDQKTGNPIDISNPLLYMGTPSVSVSFNEQLRDVAVACQPTGQGVNNPNVLAYIFNGQEGAGAANGQTALYGDCGGYPGFSGAMVVTASQTPNSSFSHMQISGGPTSGSTPFYGIVVDGQINGTGGAAGGPREIMDVTCALRAGSGSTPPETCFLIQGSRAKVGFTDVHAEQNGAQDNIYVTEGARAVFNGVEGSNTGGAVVHCSSTAGECSGDSLGPQGTNSSSANRYQASAIAFQDDSTGGGSRLGYQAHFASATSNSLVGNLTIYGTCTGCTSSIALGTSGQVPAMNIAGLAYAPSTYVIIPAGATSGQIQTILSAATAGEEIDFTGTYSACSLTMTVAQVKLHGQGMDGAVIQCATPGVPVLTISGSEGDEVDSLNLKHITSTPTCAGGSGTSTCGEGLQVLGGAARVKISNVHANFNYNGFSLGWTTLSELNSSYAEFNQNDGVHHVLSSTAGQKFQQWRMADDYFGQNLNDGWNMTCPGGFTSIITTGPPFIGAGTMAYGNGGKGYDLTCSAATTSGIADVWFIGANASSNNSDNFFIDAGTSSGRNVKLDTGYSEQAGQFSGAGIAISPQITAGFAQAAQTASGVGAGINITAACDTILGAGSAPEVTGFNLWANAGSGALTACPQTSFTGIMTSANGQAAASAQTEAGITINAALVKVAGGLNAKGTYEIYGTYLLSGDKPGITGNECDANITDANCHFSNAQPTNGYQQWIGQVKYISGSGAPTMNCGIGWNYDNIAAASTSTVHYVCQPANTWNAITVP